MEPNKKHRVKILDGFRTLAILSVMLYHYYSRWTYPRENFNLYPYGNKYTLFNHGNLGVLFFFIISGFVIAFTLHNTDNILEFWKRRIARLLPPMFICALITIIFLQLFDSEQLFPDGHSPVNFLFSLTFISPELINFFLKHTGAPINVKYLSGVYWSLWPEIQFYFIASMVYYKNPAKFIRNFLLLALLLYCINFLSLYVLHGDNAYTHAYGFIFSTLFNITWYILWFTLGILFYDIYANKPKKAVYIYTAIIIVLGLFNCTTEERLIMGAAVGLFIIFLTRPQLIHFLSYKPIAIVGMASYSLYLLHEDIGVLLINKYGSYWGQFDFLFPIFVIFLLILLSLLNYNFIEKPIYKIIHKRLNKNKPDKLQVVNK